MQEAQNSYALTQSNIQLALANQFENLWKTPLDDEDCASNDDAQESTVEAAIEQDDDDEDNSEEDGLTEYDEDEDT